MRNYRWMTIKTMAVFGVTATIALAIPPTSSAVVHAEQPSMSSSTPLYGSVSAPAVKPLWTLSLAKFDQDGTTFTTAIAEENRVFALVPGGQLAAYDGASGKQLWKYGTQLKPILVYDRSVVYGLAKDGSVFAVATNGSKKWTAAIHADKAASIHPVGDTIYVTQNLTLFALDRATGKLRWKTTETNGAYEAGLTEVAEADGVVLRSYLVQGALTSTQINAYDKATGKQLWTSFRQASPLAIKDGSVYSIMDLFMIGDNDSVNKSLHIAVLNLKTGEKKGERVYKWTTEPDVPGQVEFGGAHGSATLDGNDLYIYEDQRVAKYTFSAYSEDGKPAQTYNAPNTRTFLPLGKVHNGRLLYQSSLDNSIEVMKTANGQIVQFPKGIQPVQTDLYANGLYVARADGTLDAYDYSTFKPVLSIKTGSHDFSPTLKSGNLLYVRSGATLYAVKLPTSLTITSST